MKTGTVLTVLAASVLTFTIAERLPAQEPVAEQSAPWTCEQVMADGKTAQHRLDAIFTETAEDMRLSATVRASTRAAKADFDALCAVDAETGSREASIFAVQAGQRMKRIGDAVTASAQK